MLQVLVVARNERGESVAAALRQGRPDWRVTAVSALPLIQQELTTRQIDVLVLDLAYGDGVRWVQQWQRQMRAAGKTAVASPLILLIPAHASFPQAEQQAHLLALPELLNRVAQRVNLPLSGTNLLADVVGMTTDVVLVTTEEQIIIYVNQTVSEVLGYEAAELIGRPLDILLPARYRAIHREHLAAFGRSELQEIAKAKRAPLVARHHDGFEVAVEISIMKLKRNGRTYFAALLHDISAREKAATALLQYAHRLEVLREIDQAILAARSPQEVGQTTLAHLQHIIPFQQANIILFTSPRKSAGATPSSFLPGGGALIASLNTPQSHLGSPDHLLALHDEAAMAALLHGEARVVNNLPAMPEPLFLEQELLRQGVQAYMLAPLSVREGMVGLISLLAEQPDCFNEGHVEILRDAARSVALAIQQARLLEEERTQRQLTETLQEVAHILSSTLDLQQVLRIILDQLARVIAYDSALVMLLQDDDLRLVAQSVQESEPPCSEQQFKNLSHIQAVLNSGAPILISDTAVDGRWQPCHENSSTRSWLGIPLIAKGIVIGLLSLSKKEPAYYTHQDAEFALTFALQAAIAVENAQLYSRAIREIEERRRVEAALQAERTHLAAHVKERTAELSAANAQLARAVRARDEFLASMSHELRTPLNAILGMTEVLQTGAFGDLSDRQQNMLQTIVRSGYHLLELINDILDIAKIEAGQLVLQSFPLPLPSVYLSCLNLVNPQAAKKQIHVQCSASQDISMVWGDELRIQQILINLLNNAIKFTPAGGQVGLEVSSDPVRNTVYFTVWDTGIGMSLSDVRQLFSGPNGPRPFVQLDSGLSRQYEGTGLGLSLVYHLTELQGGSLTIRSEVGQGSRLTVALPGESILKVADAHENEDITPLSLRGKMILLAEDNELYARAISTHLLGQGYRLVVAHTGPQAVQQARNTLPDLMILDLQMPEVGGLEALHLIRENVEAQHIPVILTSALNMSGDQEYYLQQGADAFLLKPLYLPELAAKIEELLCRETRV